MESWCIAYALCRFRTFINIGIDEHEVFELIAQLTEGRKDLGAYSAPTIHTIHTIHGRCEYITNSSQACKHMNYGINPNHNSKFGLLDLLIPFGQICTSVLTPDIPVGAKEGRGVPDRRAGRCLTAA